MIDDAAPLHAVVRVRLADQQLEFFSAYDGESGVRMAAEVRPDLILLDVELPDGSGFDVCRRLKADPALVSIPVIFLTGLASPEEKVRGLNLGAVDYVTKPFDAAELQARVRVALRTSELMELLSKRAMVDGLTELWNRAYFDHRLATEQAQFKRSGQPVCCVIAGIDHFKWINDSHGHGFGDSVLRDAGKVLRAQTRTEDIVCRYAGDQFAILTPGVELPGAAVMARRLRGAIANHPFSHGGVTLSVTCSFGLAAAGSASADFVACALQALQQAKQRGRDKIVIWGEPEPGTQIVAA
jgi:diguanylate cyclase (GGDEF)-like protein